MSENAEPSQSKTASENQSENTTTNGAPGSDATGGAVSDTSNVQGSQANAESSTAASSTAASDAATTSSAADGSTAGTSSTAASSPAASSSGAELSALATGGSSTHRSTKSAAGRTSEAGTPAAAPASSAKSQKSATGARESPDSRGPTSAGAGAGTASAGGSKRPRGQRLGQLKLEEAKIGILGAGKMADALVQGLIHYVKIQPNRIHLAAPSAKNLEHFKNYGCRVTKRNYDIFGRYDCDIIFLCFHGYVIKHCYKLGGSKPHPLTTNYIPHQRHPIYILSMVSGVSLAQIKACLLNPDSIGRYSLEIHRVMMNTAVGHGLGICAIDCEPDSKKLSAPLRQLLSRIAQLEYVPASQMDAACALGGSGLAFSFYFINALADGAFKMGLSRKQAIRFASKTAQCAAQTMLESGKHPAELRDTVSAPSGAAIYGIHVLERNDVASGVTAAVEAAHKRAIDLATQEMS